MNFLIRIVMVQELYHLQGLLFLINQIKEFQSMESQHG